MHYLNFEIMAIDFRTWKQLGDEILFMHWGRVLSIGIIPEGPRRRNLQPCLGKSERNAEVVRPVVPIHGTKQSAVPGADEPGRGHVPNTLSTENIDNGNVQRYHAGTKVLVDEVVVPRRSDDRRGDRANVRKFRRS